MLQDLAAEGYFSECPANALFIMNDPSHYLADQSTDGSQAWIYWQQSDKPRQPHPTAGIFNTIGKAAEQRLNLPSAFYEDELASLKKQHLGA